jgi:hypothetical protein
MTFDQRPRAAATRLFWTVAPLAVALPTAHRFSAQGFGVRSVR